MAIDDHAKSAQMLVGIVICNRAGVGGEFVVPPWLETLPPLISQDQKMRSSGRMLSRGTVRW